MQTASTSKGMLVPVLPVLNEVPKLRPVDHSVREPQPTTDNTKNISPPSIDDKVNAIKGVLKEVQIKPIEVPKQPSPPPEPAKEVPQEPQPVIPPKEEQPKVPDLPPRN